MHLPDGVIAKIAEALDDDGDRIRLRACSRQTMRVVPPVKLTLDDHVRRMAAETMGPGLDAAQRLAACRRWSARWDVLDLLPWHVVKACNSLDDDKTGATFAWRAIIMPSRQMEFGVCFKHRHAALDRMYVSIRAPYYGGSIDFSGVYARTNASGIWERAERDERSVHDADDERIQREYITALLGLPPGTI
jgi:hypothetical protein